MLFRGCLIVVVLFGALVLLFGNLYALPFCGSSCQGAPATRLLIYLVLMLAAVVGFVWTLVRNRLNADVWGLVWFIAIVVFGFVLPTADAILR
jgi:hypothetical protein